jgi:hypothetical protein
MDNVAWISTVIDSAMKNPTKMTLPALREQIDCMVELFGSWISKHCAKQNPMVMANLVEQPAVAKADQNIELLEALVAQKETSCKDQEKVVADARKRTEELRAVECDLENELVKLRVEKHGCKDDDDEEGAKKLSTKIIEHHSLQEKAREETMTASKAVQMAVKQLKKLDKEL